ncbi:protein of unknown function [Lutibacter agarilyticus]|uniref:DUF4421 domain-containing protein n=1 Tax=Lutibacter agarilyticus TaxID=1109740 RepID=A0A238VS24_9FLAO|nr:DUF4421 family protein [Lutibacter agarilyticus]SNR37132.1 protein of unknown function [Lutibacter agarilyticus]
MPNKWLLFFSILIASGTAHAHNFKKNDTLLKPAQIIDSLVFSEKLDWSVRLVGNFKQQRFTLKNNQDKLYYKPNNPYGIGIGIANQKIIIDIVFNIKTQEEALQTDKFAAEGGLVIKKNYIGFLLENVNGYNIYSNVNDAEIFRKDMSIFSLGLNYLHLFKNEHFSVRMMKSGVTDKEKTSVSLGFGGFFIVNKISSDGTIVPTNSNPYFNDQAEITEFTAIGAGILAGVATYIVLPANFFFALSASPGIGLEYKEISAETESYVPTNPLVYKLDLFTGLGYKGEEFYVHFNFGTNLYATDLDFNNKALLSVTKSKLIFGYNIGKINFKPKKNKVF